MLHYNNTDPTLPPTIPRFFAETVTHILLPFIPRFLGGGINRRSALTEIPHSHSLDAANARKKIRMTRPVTIGINLVESHLSVDHTEGGFLAGKWGE